MSLQMVLLIGAQPEALEPLESVLVEESIVGCQQLNTLEDAMGVIETTLPDLVLIFADGLEQRGESVNTFCLSLRESQSEYRPVLVIHTGVEDESKRIDYLRDGADDILSSAVSVEELRIRLLVHLRRNLDVLSNRITRIPGHLLAAKFLQRKINTESPWALLVIELDHLDAYTEVYGQIPSEQVLRTVAALLGSVVLPPDFIGHIESNLFSVVTTVDKCEKIAAMLCQQFEAVSPNFYSERDKKRGYIVSVVDERVSRRVGLLSLSIGIVSSQSHPYESYWAAYNGAIVMKNLARMKEGNAWISEKFQLTGTQAVVETGTRPRILLIESDAALAFLLKTTLEMENYEVDAVSTDDQVWDLMNARAYQLVLLDALINGEPLGWPICQELKARFPQVRVVFISTLHDRDRALDAGADLYLPKPFELVPLFSWIHRLLRGL
jgi:DNA-binding response OmpR family regulator